MEIVNSLQQLLSLLPECEGPDYLKIAKDMNIPPSDFKPYEFWSDEGYTRNCLARTESYELLLLCWDAHQETPIHCHNGEECWVYIADGQLEEERYEMNESDDLVLVEKSICKSKDLSYMSDDMGYHLLRNPTGQRAMSLHLYINPIDQCSVYDEDEGVFIYKELEYDTVKGKVGQSV